MSSTPEHGEINLGESRANSIVIGKQYSTLYFFVVQGCYPMANDSLSYDSPFPIVGRYYENNNMHLLTLQKTAAIQTKRNGQILPVSDSATYENGIITFKSNYCIFYTFNWSSGQPKWEIIVHWIGW